MTATASATMDEVVPQIPAAEHLVALARRLGLDVSLDDARVANLLERERALR